MDRSCSWWNAEQTVIPADYVLQHEQIHFALTEIHARKINEEITKLRMRASSREHAPSVARAHVQLILEAAARELLAESRRFDEQSSTRMDKEAQARWQLAVEARLRR